MTRYNSLPLLERVIIWLDRQPKSSLLVISVALMGLIGVIDYRVTLDLGLSIFYLLPIAIGAWGINRRTGLSLSILSGSIWMFADYTVKQYPNLFLPAWNTSIRLGFFLIITYLLSALKIAYIKEQQFARVDGLTGSSNRRFFMETLQVECDRARRHHYPLTLAYMDLDNFKTINDRWGHAVGDQVLKATVKAIQKSIRSSDYLGRMGGDEFALLLPQTDYDQAKIVLSRLYGQLSNLRHAHGWNGLGYSIGAITFMALPRETDEILDRVDMLMYNIKHSSKNRLECQIFNPLFHSSDESNVHSILSGDGLTFSSDPDRSQEDNSHPI